MKIAVIIFKSLKLFDRSLYYQDFQNLMVLFIMLQKI